MLLNCHSYYSLNYGTFSEKELIRLALQAGAQTAALTDINNTSGCLNFIRKAKEAGLKPVVGVDFRNGVKPCFIALAKNNQGFQEINQFLSEHLHEEKPFPERAPDFENVIVIYSFRQVQKLQLRAFKPYEFIGAEPRDLLRLPFSGLDEFQNKIVALYPWTFRNKTDFNVHRLLRAIGLNKLLSKLLPEEQAEFNEVVTSLEKIHHCYRDFPLAIQLTNHLLEQCRIDFDFSEGKESQNLKTYTGSKEKDKALLRELCEKGLPYRYPEVTTIIHERIEKELDLIEKMNFVPFFLINWDIVSYAQSKGYYYVGRGSGANSIVAYLLRITDVDPIELDLYFERFMNLYRTFPPDFDIDFSWRDREDVTRYIFERFGKNGQAALLATYSTFQHNGAIRELGKVFGLPNHEIEFLSRGEYREANLDELSRLVVRYARRLNGMPSHLSVHSAGILIAEKPMHYFTGTFLPPKGFPTTQFDMIVAEDVGLYKFDILGQRGLSKIKETVEIVHKNHPDITIDIHDVKNFMRDPEVNGMVSQADCIGCFYVESPAMRMLLKKLEVKTYLELVAASSIIRPGVAKSGMMREYILRHKDPERRKEAHPVMQEIMPETYGIMVYQEDVIKVAHYFGGLTLGEADVLRRGMSGKYRSRDEFQLVKDKFFQNCRDQGYPEKMIVEVWFQIESFAGYAFAKGHSASYAVESYQSLFLKRYYPLEYIVAVVNNGGGFYRTELYLHEAKMKGATIHAPCINTSFYDTRIIGKDIFLGFHLLNGLYGSVAKAILLHRKEKGAFTSLQDFLNHIPIGVEQLDILIRVGAFRFTGQNKRALLWYGCTFLNKSGKVDQQKKLFSAEVKEQVLPKFELSDLEHAFDQIELLGFPLCNTFQLLANPPKNKQTAKDLMAYLNREIELYGYLITIKKTRTSHGDRMSFGTFIDREGNWVDTVHFPPSLAKYPFRGKGIYRIKGLVVNEFDFLSLEVNELEKVPFISDPRYTDARLAYKKVG